MANLQATLRGQTALDTAVGDTVARSNRLIYESTDPEKFATLFVGRLDALQHSLSYCNAGNENPMLFRAGGKLERLATGGMALGVLDDFPYQEDTASLQPGDTLVIYSDGIPDAVNEFEVPFGEERLVKAVEPNVGLSASGIMDKIVAAVHAHEQGAERIDDLTVIVLKRIA
jgi:phosphoserine phosphatase RsbU/P